MPMMPRWTPLSRRCRWTCCSFTARRRPARVAEVKARYGLPVMKALGVADEGDLAGLLEMSLAADQILIDAKPPKGATLPGGNGWPSTGGWWASGAG
jgi:phosphoribosylanthranilate isomerase